jgi:hypothetical protein
MMYLYEQGYKNFDINDKALKIHKSAIICDTVFQTSGYK